MKKHPVPATFLFDSSDPALLRELMKEYGDSESFFTGTNDNGEDMTISIAKTGIITTTFQANKWLRQNFYAADGSREGETFSGRWN